MILTQRLLLENEKDGIDQFDVFDVIVDHVVGRQALNGQRVLYVVNLSVLRSSSGTTRKEVSLVCQFRYMTRQCPAGEKGSEDEEGEEDSGREGEVKKPRIV